ncbi:hypothetical protein EG328_008272 [Venturia inaequalis]|uniref:Uncharacterized protein n=1 Tax=Venturia inaequalis TaxID=5025 RepID=A0A8H3UBC6_VENIN|nr:hypothetical protein EG328_008272 [Venturia inaequalis]
MAAQAAQVYPEMSACFDENVAKAFEMVIVGIEKSQSPNDPTNNILDDAFTARKGVSVKSAASNSTLPSTER